MSITFPFVGRRDRRKHRAVDKVAELRDENRRLLAWQMAADDFFAILTADREQVYGAWEFTEERRQEAEKVAACTLEENAVLAAEVAGLWSRLAPFLAAEANAHRITPPPMVRDTSAIEDQATGPIDVRSLREALTAPCAECTAPVPKGTTFCSARCRNAADDHNDYGQDGDL
ncbi:hypothetical protein [Streptomyces sp. NPDC005799]|uniref:hypothetical protein n=1 Tax=Streptomyces sp. NPDC005799 TaxID=3154678 RepID=UPI003408EF38